jgi:hypothetical protein
MGLAAIPVAITAVAAIASTAAAVQSARAQAQAANYNAQMQKYNADILQQQGQQDAANVLQQGQIIQGKARAAAAASGLGESGSVQDVSYANLVGNEQDALAAKYRGTIEGYNATNQARLDSMSAQNAEISGGINVAGSLLSGASKTYGAYDSSQGNSVQPIFGQTTTSNRPTF